jgi:hypothetical protein
MDLGGADLAHLPNIEASVVVLDLVKGPTDALMFDEVATLFQHVDGFAEPDGKCLNLQFYSKICTTIL